MKKNNATTIVLLDAHAIIHRAYHGLPNFATSTGIPSGALYGLVSMVLRIVEELKPDHVIACYDLPKPTFRHHAYDAYKGTRAKIDDALIEQLKSSRSLFAAFGIPCLDAEGFEADDVIGTLATQYGALADTRIIIASGDMDTMQLVEGKKIQVFTLKKSITDTVLYDEAAVKERFGFAPKSLPDFKGLRGDPSDNIIGIPGIGEKTATTLVQKFGTIEKMYQSLEKKPEVFEELVSDKASGITARIVRLLMEHKDEAIFSKTLAVIRRDAPVQYALPEKGFFEIFDEEKARDFLASYEFSSLVPRMKKVFLLAERVPQEEIDPVLLREASIALWVLYSEITTPTYEQVLERAKKKTLAEAYAVIVSELEKRNLLGVFEHIERPIVPIVEAMQVRGIGIDRSYFETLSIEYKKKLETLESRIREACGIADETLNLNSPKQLSSLLFDTLKLKPKGKRKDSGAFTTNAETLEGLRDAHPVIALLLEHREIQKLVSTYIDAIPGHAIHEAIGDRVHATFLQHGTTTGRFSSTNPNLQNIPTDKHIRHGFVAAPGHVFVSCDYSQIELRVLAMMSEDAALRDSFVKGNDIHATVASIMFGVPINDVSSDMRRSAKVVNFGILYGMGISALQKNLDMSREKTTAFYQDYFNAFPTIGAFMESSKQHAKDHGYTETLFGRRRYFPSINAGAPFLRAFAERTAANAPIQGTAADIIKIAIALVHEDLSAAGLLGSVHLVLQVHDELVYEIAEPVLEQAKSIIVSAMESVFTRSPLPFEGEAVPLKVSCGVGARLDEVK